MPNSRSRGTKFTDTNDKSDRKGIRNWDCSPLTLRAFLISLFAELPKLDANHRTFVRGRYVTSSRGMTIVMSAEHAVDIDDGTVASKGHSFENPMPAGEYKKTTTAMPASLDKQYQINQQTLLDTANTNLLSDITDRFDDQDCADEYIAAADGDACTLIYHLVDEAANVTDTQSDEVLTMMTTASLLPQKLVP